MIIGADIGNHSTKTSTGTIIESRVSEKPNILKSKFIEINGQTYYIEEGTHNTEYRKVKKTSLLPLLYYVLGKEQTFTFKVVIGLPIGQFKEDSEELKNLILKEQNIFINIDKQKKRIFIEDVYVYPEGIAWAKNKNYTGIIIDIGGRSTDTAFINSDGKIEEPRSIPQGTLNLFASFIDLINSRYGLDLKQNMANSILTNGLKLQGVNQDISFAMIVFKEYIENLMADLNTTYSLNALNVTCIGGGSELLKSPLLKRIPHASIPQNSIFANANGFKEVGESIWL